MEDPMESAWLVYLDNTFDDFSAMKGIYSNGHETYGF